MAWGMLVIAGLLEIGWAIGLKMSHGFTRPVASAVTIVTMILSLGFLGVAIRTLPIGTAYAIWTGIGTVGAVIVGVAMFGESASIYRLVCVLLIVAGIVGLKVVGSH